MINIPEHIPHLSLLHIINKRMAIILLQAIGITLLVAKAASQQPQPDTDFTVPTPIIIPLDQPVDVRLASLHSQFSSNFNQDFQGQIKTVKKSLGWFGYHVAKMLLTFYMNVKGDPIMYDEISSYADTTGIDFGDIVFLNYFYEAGCTSIIGRAGDQRTLLFGSNLDFDHANFIRKYTYQGVFTRGGQTVFTGNGIYGMVGVVRGQRINNVDQNFAISINERDVDRGNLLINLFFTEAIEVVYFIRKTLQLSSYQDALNAIMSQTLTTAAYYTIGGTWTTGGCVVERSANSVHNKTCLCTIDPTINQCDNSTGTDLWFIVQTNYDRDLPDPSDDYRRVPTENLLNSMGQANFNNQSLYNILTTPPVKRVQTDEYLSITTIVCQNEEDQRTSSTWQMIMWNDYPPGA